MPLGSLSKDFQRQSDALVNKYLLSNPRVKCINGRPLSGYMLLNLALAFVDSFNAGEAPVVLNCFERVVSIESDRFLDELYERALEKIHQTFTFEPGNNGLPFENLETVYSNSELDDFLANLVDECDLEIAKRLQTILPVKALVE